MMKHTIMVAISTYLALNALVTIPLCTGSPHLTFPRTRFQNRSILRRAATNISENGSFLSTTSHWINQTLDHFSSQDSRKFQQRFFEFLDYFNAPHGPIFLSICGESTCEGIYNDYIGVLAKRFGAALVTLEHRYYGYSYPFRNLKIKNLKFLNSKQALSDLAKFRNHYQDLINVRYNLSSTSENPWITFGGSYAGALSAWFRLKFPHLTRGSIASSAVVHAIEDYYAYDQQVAESLGPECTRALQAVKASVNYYMAKNATQLKSMFNAESIKEDDDFLFLLADATDQVVQYGYQDILCKPLVQKFHAGGNMLIAYQYFFKHSYGTDPLYFSREYMKNYTMAGGPGSGLRLWTYQYCTEFGFLIIAPTTNNIRFSELNHEYFLNLCSYIFGEGTRPNPDATNLFYGGEKIAGSKILFTNGSQDPWRHAAKQVSTLDEPVIVIKCRNCAHCVDITGCTNPISQSDDASFCEPQDSIDEARTLIAEYIKLWIRN